MADENTIDTNVNEEQNPIVDEPTIAPEETNEEEVTPEKKAKAAYIALRYLGVTPPSL